MPYLTRYFWANLGQAGMNSAVNQEQNLLGQQGCSQNYLAAMNLGAQNAYGAQVEAIQAYQSQRSGSGSLNIQAAGSMEISFLGAMHLSVTKYRGSRYATPGLHPVWGVHGRGYRYGK